MKISVLGFYRGLAEMYVSKVLWLIYVVQRCPAAAAKPQLKTPSQIDA
jgi:hypothetical protein